MARLNAAWYNFSERGQAWYHFWQDTATGGVVSYVLTANAGIFSIAGQSANEIISRIVSASSGSLSIAGQSVTVKVGYLVSAGFGAFAISGQNATASVSRLLNAGVGTFAISGQSVTVRVDRTLNASYGAFAITGQDATLDNVAGGVTNYVMTAQAGVFGITGQDIDLNYHHTVPIPILSPTLAGNGNQSRYYYGQKPRRTIRTLREKKQELQRDLEVEERERQHLLAVAAAKEAELARLQVLISPRAYRATAIVPYRAMRSIANSAQKAIDELKSIIAEKERRAAEHARKEKEIEELLLLDAA